MWFPMPTILYICGQILNSNITCIPGQREYLGGASWLLSLARNLKLFGPHVGRLQKEYKLVYSLYVEILNYTVHAQRIMLSSGTLEQS